VTSSGECLEAVGHSGRCGVLRAQSQCPHTPGAGCLASTARACQARQCLSTPANSATAGEGPPHRPRPASGLMASGTKCIHAPHARLTVEAPSPVRCASQARSASVTRYAPINHKKLPRPCGGAKPNPETRWQSGRFVADVANGVTVSSTDVDAARLHGFRHLALEVD